jgi:TonB family protein
MSILIASSLKVSIVILIGLASAGLLRKRSAAVRHWILAMTIACAATVPVLESYVPSWGMDFSSPNPAAVSEAAPPPAGPSGAVEFAIRDTVPAVRPQRLALTDLLVPAWTLGVAASLFVLVAGFARLLWLASRARPVAPGAWTILADEIGRAYGLTRPVRLLESDHPSLLVTWGLVQPKVIIPRAARDWSDARIAVVLRHELAHVRRGDWLVQIVGELMRSIYWFNPLLWIACTRLRLESEQACDDEVITGGVNGEDYATHLLELARALKADAAPRVPAPAVARPSSLERRIRAMLDRQLSRAPTTRAARFLTAAVLLTLTVAVAGAQTGPVKLSGLVFDTTGAPVPGVTVALVNTQTQARYEVKTDQTGHYEFVPLPADSYKLEAAYPGFGKFGESVTLSGSNARRDVTMSLGSLTETITVKGSPEATGPDTRGRVTAVSTDVEQAAKAMMQKAIEECKPSTTGGRVRPPRKIKDVKPVYPAALQAAGITGVVGLKAVIATDGSVREVTVEKSAHPELDAAAMEAVRQWKFDGTLLNCGPVEVSMGVSINFQ